VAPGSRGYVPSRAAGTDLLAKMDARANITMIPKASAGSQRDVVTLADLVPRHRVTGGSERRVFGADALVRGAEDETMAGAKKVTKDLPSKTTRVTGGKLATNDSLTLVRMP
jgi:hypothetical protein